MFPPMDVNNTFHFNSALFIQHLLRSRSSGGEGGIGQGRRTERGEEQMQTEERRGNLRLTGRYFIRF